MKKIKEKLPSFFRRRDRTTKGLGRSTVMVDPDAGLLASPTNKPYQSLGQEDPLLVAPTQSSITQVVIRIDEKPSSPDLQADDQIAPGPPAQLERLPPGKEGLDPTATKRKVPSCWQRALAQLDEEQRKVIGGLEVAYKTEDGSPENDAWTQVLDLQKRCELLQQRYEDTSNESDLKLSFTWREKKISMSFKKILNGLVEIAGGLESTAQVAVSIDPVHAVWPYLLVKALFAVSSLARAAHLQR